MGHRGDLSLDFIVKAILILLSAAIFLSLILPIGEWFGGTTDITACRTSILFYQQKKELATEFFYSSRELNCKAPHTDYDLKGLRLQRELADDLKNCWQKSAGHANHLGKDLVSGNEKVCLVCSTLTLPEKIETKDMEDFLNKKTPSSGGGATYARVLDTDWKGETWGFFPQVLTLNGDFARAENLRVFPASYAVIALSSEDPSGYNHVFILPEDQIKNLGCSVVISNPVGERKSVGVLPNPT